MWRGGVLLVALAAVGTASDAALGEGLPDGRVYEQVSPVKKNGHSAGAARGVKYAVVTADGDGILYSVDGPMGSAPRGLETSAVGRRGSAGWSSASAIPAGSRDRIDATSYLSFGMVPSSDLTKVLFTSGSSFVPDNPDTGVYTTSGALYMGHADGTVDWLSRPRIADAVPAPGNIVGPFRFQVVGAAPDLSRVYFYGEPTLLPEDAGRLASGLGGWGLWEYSGGELKAAGTLPDGSESPGGAAPASSKTGPAFHFVGPDSTSQQVSRDGSTLLFVSPDPGANPVTQLYLRRNGRSTLVSRTSDDAVAPSGVAPVRTLTAQPAASTSAYAYGSADGSTVIFQSVDALAAGAPNDPSQKVYRYDVATDTVSYLPGVAGTVVAASDDDARFLFTDTTRIALWDEGTVTTIAPIGAYNNQLAPARATPSGSVFLFSTQVAIPGFNNGAGALIQVYRYDVAAGKLTCLSCPPAGVTPTGSASLSNQDEPGALDTNGELVASRGMSESGDRVFFDSPDPLVTSDTNGQQDVYEWTVGGLSLISSGRSHDGSFLLDNSADGNDVFFATTEGLDASDHDGNYDVYDARVGGGFKPVDQTAPCVGDACQGGVSVDPPSPVTASGVFSGPGDRPATQEKAAPSAKLKLGSHKLIGGVLEISVTMARPGRVSVSGAGLRGVAKSYVKAGSYSVKVPLTAPASRSLKRRHRLKLSVRVGFTPVSGAASAVRFVINAKA
jgi:hypothetical protein